MCRQVHLGDKRGSILEKIGGIALLKYRFGVCSDMGAYKNRNEDNFYFQNKTLPNESLSPRFTDQTQPVSECMAAVFDGMGGQSFGDETAAFAAKVLSVNEASMLSGGDGVVDDYVSYVNRCVCKVMDQRHARMGSTMVMMRASGNTITIYNIGDSRAYLVADRCISQLSKDHTVTETLVSIGQLTPEQARKDPRRHQLTQHFGIHENEMMLKPYSSGQIVVHSGVRVLLCSDGVSDVLEDEELGALLLTNKKPYFVSELIVDAAIAAGSKDNVTALVCEITDDDKPSSNERKAFSPIGYWVISCMLSFCIGGLWSIIFNLL